jgi:cytochrome c peroxidase
MANSRSTPVEPGDERFSHVGRVLHCLLAALCTVALGAAVHVAAREGLTTAPTNEPITPIPSMVNLDSEKVRLGERLFQDTRLSHDNTVSCTSCHHLDRGGDDDQIRAIGADGRPLNFNTSTVFNASLNFRLNWRGNFRTLEEQNEAVLRDRSLMNSNWEELLPRLNSDPYYLERFTEIYGTGPQRLNVLDALANYQQSLITPNARFDRYLNGNRDAITGDENSGYQLFKANGCIACHQGVNVGGNLFQKFGIFSDPFASQKSLTVADLGRFAITGVESDRHVFRVPSLRNVALTAPYFHDGRAVSLPEAVQIMARSQLGREISARDIDLIVKFLGTLTGEYHGRILTGEADRTLR